MPGRGSGGAALRAGAPALEDSWQRDLGEERFAAFRATLLALLSGGG